MLPSVHIRKEALLSMIWSAIDPFKKECVGFVLGHRPTEKRSFYYVTDAIPFVSLKKRLNTEVEFTKRLSERFTNFISLIKSIYPKYLGDFHSHAEWGIIKPPSDMSKEDIKAFTENNYELEFIIKITSRRKGQAPWEILPDCGIKGSFSRFDFNINVFTIDRGNEEKTPLKLQIVASSAIKALNRIQLKR